ncbi:GIGANTUS 1 [Hibiscus trionum]|uniref:GIGANTUS 1 n=1 Tax=Hibiscus trionum TaxID=183268 RepID=A0A9W7H3T9_HIBTR|nr:GIGANTUS 1 [Hibiscus trionum]
MEVEASEMEVEQQQQQPVQNSQSSTKAFGLKNSIQTNFGDDYVFQIVPRDDWTSMAVSLSTNAVKLYSPMTGQYLGECKGHSSTINHICFSGASNQHVLHSCSSDGTIRAWDTRNFQQVSCITAGSSQEVFSFSFGGSDDNLLAAGCQSQILFWDWRNRKQVSCLEESHVDDVTQVHFVPGHQNKLASASADGLICIFDTNGDINDDDHLESVINVGTSIAKIGFLGDFSEKLWCLSNIETLSVWNWNEGTNEANFEDARSLASESWTLDHVDYFVDCHSSGGENLWVIGGTNGGSLGYFPVKYKGEAVIGPPEAVLGGGHMGVVRSILPTSNMQSGPAQSRGIFGWTGGEDGRLCCWMSDDSPEISRSWITSALAKKSPRTRKNCRHQPY